MTYAIVKNVSAIAEIKKIKILDFYMKKGEIFTQNTPLKGTENVLGACFVLPFLIVKGT